ncbi:MAG TPA: MBL fold metallo-hydrolase [Burkholderiaceae bacterium]|jgi:phosphoribosyl 1,2-cyclic phosphodiesterase|nr:MBL fold metallo-hydrolase [Burkholderiaceae bacterium]
MLRFCCLGSGSGGNAFVVEASEGPDTVRVLIDDGFSPRALERRLARAGVDPGSLSAILVTHEHSDHAGGVCAFAQRRQIGVYATEGTALAAGFDPPLRRYRIRAGIELRMGPLRVLPIDVPHDASEPVQFLLSDGERRLAILTDLGHPAPSVTGVLSGLDTLVLEFNHDLQMLRRGPYSPSLKARIESDVGHLSNAQSVQFLESIDRSRLTRVVAAHLSRTNNRPHLAFAALECVRLSARVQLDVADQALGLPWRAVGLP